MASGFTAVRRKLIKIQKLYPFKSQRTEDTETRKDMDKDNKQG
jgi:hypothetical protein